MCIQTRALLRLMGLEFNEHNLHWVPPNVALNFSWITIKRTSIVHIPASSKLNVFWYNWLALSLSLTHMHTDESAYMRRKKKGAHTKTKASLNFHYTNEPVNLHYLVWSIVLTK